MLDENFQQVYPLALRAAAVHSAAFALTSFITAEDREDLQQEAAFQVWRALRRFDSRRGSLSTFVDRVVCNQVVSFVRHHRRWSLHAARLGGEAVCERCPAALSDLRIDIARGLVSLPDKEREVALQLMEFPPAEVSRRLRIARSTVYNRMAHIQDQFEAIGLGQRKVGPQCHSRQS